MNRSIPLELRAGHIYLPKALESIGVLHISLWGPEWCKKDMFILPNVIRNVGPLQEHKHTTLGDLRT